MKKLERERRNLFWFEMELSRINKAAKEWSNGVKTRVQRIWKNFKSARAVHNPSERIDTESRKNIQSLNPA